MFSKYNTSWVDVIENMLAHMSLYSGAIYLSQTLRKHQTSSDPHLAVGASEETVRVSPLLFATSHDLRFIHGDSLQLLVR